jgi:uncharacterized protein (TIGR02300 family)
VAKPELGSKRHCQSCGAKFYDLNKDPIICPRCGAAFMAAAVAGRSRAEPVAARAVEEEEIEPEVAGPEMVSLDEVEAEEAGKEVVAEDDVEIEDDLVEEDDTFLEEEEVADDDVADLIDGDIESDEEA